MHRPEYKQRLKKMERDVFNALNFQIKSSYNANTFLNRFKIILDLSDKVFRYGQLIMMIAKSDVKFFEFKESYLAFVSLQISANLLSKRQFSKYEMEKCLVQTKMRPVLKKKVDYMFREIERLEKLMYEHYREVVKDQSRCMSLKKLFAKPGRYQLGLVSHLVTNSSD